MTVCPSASEGSAAAKLFHRSILAHGGLSGGLGQRANRAGVRTGLGLAGNGPADHRRAAHRRRRCIRRAPARRRPASASFPLCSPALARRRGQGDLTVDEFLQAQVLGKGGWQEQAALATRRWSSKTMRIRPGLFCGSIYWVLLVSGRFFVTKPLSQIQRSTFLPFQEASHTPLFGGMGITLIVRILTGWIPFIGFIVTLALLLPSLAVTVAGCMTPTGRDGGFRCRSC